MIKDFLFNGQETGYKISSDGYFISKCGKPMSSFKHDRGYSRVFLRIDDDKKAFYVAREVAKAFVPNPNNFTEVSYKDNDKEKTSADNLYWTNKKLEPSKYVAKKFRKE